MKVFITGTGTNIGKTVVSAWLLSHLAEYSYWKPVQSGSEKDSDVQFVSQFSKNIFQPIYNFNTPLSPHIASEMEGINIDINHIINNLPKNNNLIIEGAGGVLVPLNNNETIIDLIKLLNIPVIIIASSSLGTINHTCLTIEALKNRAIPILGVIMNGEKNLKNKQSIEHFGKTKVLDEIESFDQTNFKESFSKKKLSSNLFDIFI